MFLSSSAGGSMEEGRMQANHGDPERIYLSALVDSGIFYDSRYSVPSCSSSTNHPSVAPRSRRERAPSLYIEKESKEKIIIINPNENVQMKETKEMNILASQSPEVSQNYVYRQQPPQQRYQYQNQLQVQQPVRIHVNTSRYNEAYSTYEISKDRLPFRPARVSVNYPPTYRGGTMSSVVFAENKFPMTSKFSGNFDPVASGVPLIIYPDQIRNQQPPQSFATSNCLPGRSSITTSYSLQYKNKNEPHMEAPSVISFRRSPEVPLRNVHYINSKPFFEPLNQDSSMYSNISLQPWESEVRMYSNHQLTMNEATPVEIFEGNSTYPNDWSFEKRFDDNDQSPMTFNVYDEGQCSNDQNSLKFTSGPGVKNEPMQIKAVTDKSVQDCSQPDIHYREKDPSHSSEMNPTQVQEEASNKFVYDHVEKEKNSKDVSSNKCLHIMKNNHIVKAKNRIAFKKVLDKSTQRLEPSLLESVVLGNNVSKAGNSESHQTSQICEDMTTEVKRNTEESCIVDYKSKNIVDRPLPSLEDSQSDGGGTSVQESAIAEQHVLEEVSETKDENKEDGQNEIYDVKSPSIEAINETKLETYSDKQSKIKAGEVDPKENKTDDKRNGSPCESARESHPSTSSAQKEVGKQMILDRISSISQELKAHKMAEWNAKCVYDIYRAAVSVKDSANKYLIPACLYFGGVISGYPLLIPEILRRRYCFKMYLEIIYNVISAKRPEIPPDLPVSSYTEQINDLCEVRDEYTLASVQKILPLVKNSELQVPGVSQQWAIAVILTATKITNKSQYDAVLKKLKPFVRTQSLVNSYQKTLRRRMSCP